MRRLLASCGVIRSKPVFARFWLGSMTSRTGSAISAVAVAWLVLSIAGPEELGIVWLCYGLPRLLSGPVAGRLLDRFQPRILLAIDNLSRASLVVAIPVLDQLGHLSVAHIYGMALLYALVSPWTEVAEQALIPRLVDDSELDSANALLSLNWEMAYVLGPLLAGLVIGVAGASTALLVDSVTFLVMALVSATLPRFVRRRSPAQQGSRTSTFTQRSGLVRLLANRPLLVVSSVTIGFVLMEGMTEVVYPVYIRDALEASPGAYGTFLASAAAGALCGALIGVTILRRLDARVRIGLALVTAVPLFLSLAVVTTVWLAWILVAIASFVIGPYYALERTLAQRLTPADIRGSVFGIRVAATSVAFPVGSALAGALLSVTDAASAIAVLAMIYGLFGLVLLFRPLGTARTGKVQVLTATTATGEVVQQTGRPVQ